MLLVQIIIELILALILFQDLKGRAVLWVLFPLLTVLFVVLRQVQGSLSSETFKSVTGNTVFLMLIWAVLSMVFSVRNRQWTNITNEMLGWGDILFLFSITFYLSILNFLIFFCVSIILTLVIWITWQFIAKHKSKHLPLAGLQAIILAIVLAIDWWCFSIDVKSDNYWITVLMNI